MVDVLVNRKITVIAHDIRSTHNIGSLLRTCDGLGVEKLYLTGYTPCPKQENDNRLPHLANKIDAQIHKTALGAENTVIWEHCEDAIQIIKILKNQGYKIIALEQSQSSIPLPHFKPPDKLAILLGTEVKGLSPDLIAQCSQLIEIPMLGQKESFNVSVAAAIALYHVRFFISD